MQTRTIRLGLALVLFVLGALTGVHLSRPPSSVPVKGTYSLIIGANNGNEYVVDYNLTVEDCNTSAVDWRKGFTVVLCERN